MTDPVPLVAAKQYLALAAETEWGTIAETPTYIHVPYEECSINLQTKVRQAQTAVGLLGEKYSRVISGMPSGDLKARLYGWIPAGSDCLAKVLLDWGFLDQETADVRSKTIEKYEGPGDADKRWLGMRCSKATLQVTEDNGIDLGLSLIGRYEEGQGDVVAQALPTQRRKLGEFVQEDATLTIGGTAAPFASLTRETTRTFGVFNYQSTTPQVMRNTHEAELWSVTIPKQDDTYDLLRAALAMQDLSLSLTLKGLHYGTGGSGNYSQVVIAATVARIETVGETVIQGLQHQVLNCRALKPDSSTARSTHTWSEV